MPDSKKKREWMAENKKNVTISIMRRTEADILERLETVPKKAEYIKRLIREDIAKTK